MTQPTQSRIEAYTEGIVVACQRPDGRWLFIPPQRDSATATACLLSGGVD
jgi:hypothetical protein